MKERLSHERHQASLEKGQVNIAKCNAVAGMPLNSVSASPRIAIIMPAYSHFGPSGSTSIDLCVRELIENSAFGNNTSIVRTSGTVPFAGFRVIDVPPTSLGHRYRALRILRELKKAHTDVIVVQQHLPTARFLSVLTSKPVIFHGHNYQKASKNSLSKWRKERALAGLSGVVLVSEACKADFLDKFDFAGPVAVIQNGLNMSEWTASGAKAKRVLVIGRCAPEKGIHEAAEAILSVLPKHPDWSAEFILSETSSHLAYYEALRDKIGDRQQINVRTEQEHDEVRTAYHKAAAALVLSNVDEGFGRTALEALASGCALVTTGKGGLREVCGDYALYTDPQDKTSASQLLDYVLSDSRVREILSEGGRSRVSSLFDIRKLSDEFFRFVTNPSGAYGIEPMSTQIHLNSAPK